MMKTLSILITTIAILSAVLFVADFLLLQDNQLHTSIASIIAYSRQFADKQHLIILGLLPIYIATVVFGTTLLTLYLIGRIKSILCGKFCEK